MDLLVDPANGQVRINNDTTDVVDINYYEITSNSGSLDPSDGSGWNSFENQNLDAIGPDAGESWTKAGGSSADILSEFFTLGSTSLVPSAALSLGKAFNVSGSQDLEFRYASPGAMSLTTGTVSYGTIETGGAAGDYNSDGVVNAADYTVWRDNVGAPAGTLPGDVAGSVIGQAQYDIWKTYFGNTTALSASAGDSAVPEPATALLLMLGAVGTALGRVGL